MPLYFLILNAETFHRQLAPALSASWRQRSFEPCRTLCAALLPAAQAFAERYHLGSEEPLLTAVFNGMAFDRHCWRALVGEVLWYSARDIPEFQTAPDTLCCLLAPDVYRQPDWPRERFVPIQQVHFGTRDLVFGGGFYRPEHAGWNDVGDVARLAAYLEAIHPEHWTVRDLDSLRDAANDEERADELEWVREWFPALQHLYRGAAEGGQIVVCEVL